MKRLPSRGGCVTIEILRNPQHLAAIGAAWRSLEERAGAGAFQSYDWISAWWNGGAATAGFRLHLALAWDGSELVGVLPLVVRRHYGLRVLEWAAKDVSDYCDVLLAPSRDELIVPLWRSVCRHGGFDVAYLSHLPPGGVLARLGEDQLGLRLGRRFAVASSTRLDTWSSGAEFMKSLTAGERQNYRRSHKILAQSGPVCFRVLRGAEVWPAIEQLRQMKLDWLNRAGLASPLFSDDGTMLRSLSAGLEARGRLRVFVLEAGNRVAAVLLCIAESNRLLGLNRAYDHGLHRASPGTLALIEKISWAVDNGCTEVDFLCGDEAYKQRLAGTQIRLTTLVHARTPIGIAAILSDSFIPRIARLRATLRSLSGSVVSLSRIFRA
jgi:CelD/BcsL family acetyltransferase involved in cellulose biosynthesis